MYQKRLSMWLYKQYKNFLYCLLSFIMLSGCNYTNIFTDEEVRSNVFINNISERRGMVIKQNLLKYFPNQNISTATYIIKVNTTKSDNFYLATTQGFGTRKRVSIHVYWSIVDRETNDIISSFSDTYFDTFNVSSNENANKSNEQLVENNLSILIAQNIALQASIFIKRLQEIKE